MDKGILYGLGVGPGDPELMTVKAARILRECDVVAVPRAGENEKTALKIAASYIGDKPVLHCEMPMTRPEAPCGIFRDVSRTSRAFSPKMARRFR